MELIIKSFHRLIDLINAYKQAYLNSTLDGISGDLRTPISSVVVGENLTPAQAFEELLKWGGKK